MYEFVLQYDTSYNVRLSIRTVKVASIVRCNDVIIISSVLRTECSTYRYSAVRFVRDSYVHGSVVRTNPYDNNNESPYKYVCTPYDSYGFVRIRTLYLIGSLNNGPGGLGLPEIILSE